MSETSKIKALVADDHKLLLTGLAHALKDEDIDIVAKTHILDEIVPLYREFSPDVVILDINFGQRRNGLDILDELLEIDPSACVVIFSQYDQTHLVEQAYRKGAKGYLNKLAEIDEVVAAVKKAANNDIYLQQSISENLALARLGKPVSENPNVYNVGIDIEKKLKPKEFQIFLLLAKGFTQNEIFKYLENDPENRMAERTIANLSTTVRKKLNVKSNAELAILAFKAGYVE